MLRALRTERLSQHTVNYVMARISLAAICACVEKEKLSSKFVWKDDFFSALLTRLVFLVFL